LAARPRTGRRRAFRGPSRRPDAVRSRLAARSRQQRYRDQRLHRLDGVVADLLSTHLVANANFSYIAPLGRAAGLGTAPAITSVTLLSPRPTEPGGTRHGCQPRP